MKTDFVLAVTPFNTKQIGGNESTGLRTPCVAERFVHACEGYVKPLC